MLTISLFGHVWVWQRNNDWGTVSVPFLLIVTREPEEWERERRNSEYIVELEPSSPCKRLTEERSKDTKW